MLELRFASSLLSLSLGSGSALPLSHLRSQRPSPTRLISPESTILASVHLHLGPGLSLASSLLNLVFYQLPKQRPQALHKLSAC